MPTPIQHDELLRDYDRAIVRARQTLQDESLSLEDWRYWNAELYELKRRREILIKS